MFNKKYGFEDMPVQVPCGGCIGCRLERSRQWAIRCVHEAKLYEKNCFITLTYNDENLPYPPSLDIRHFQLFMKKLRKKLDHKIRVFYCGEYGDEKHTRRPHFHAILFNFAPSDGKKHLERNGNVIYTSEFLTETWAKGYASYGDVTFESAAYTARYSLKKRTGKGAIGYYEWYCPETGVVFELRPEFGNASRRGGIGADWFKRYRSDYYPSDQTVVRGIPMQPPKFYDSLNEAADEDQMRRVRASRIVRAREHESNNTKERLKAREAVQQARLKLLVRNLE